MSGRRSLRYFRVGAVLAAVGMALAACAPAAAPKASETQAEAFPEVYAQSIDWGECGDAYGLTSDLSAALQSRGVAPDSFRCATVEAPRNWNDAGDAETITLAVNRREATGSGPKLGTLFGNPGGPGASGLEYAFGMSAAPGFDRIAADYDVVGFDPRGIGRSTPVDCDDSSDVFEIRIAVCADQHPLARSMGTSQVARDMELLRHLVNDEKFNYLGYSYGTMLGATYSTLFPEKVGRMALDSASPADWAGLIGSFDQSAAFSQQIAQLLARCGTTYEATSCPMRSEDDFMATMAALDAHPLLATDGTALDGGMLHGYLGSALYTRGAGRTEALDTVAGVLAGDQAQIDDLVAAMADGGSAVGTAGMIVRCHSFPADPDVVGLLAHIEEVGMPALLGGPELTDDNLRPFADLGCDALAESGDDITDSFHGSPDSAMLVVGITGDHATPYPGAQEMVAQLGNARLVTLEGAGHGASFTGRSVCIDEAVSAYLLEGTLPAEGLVCSDDQG